MTEDHCPTCGSLVTVSMSDEWTGCYLPIRAAANSEADSARLDWLEANAPNVNGLCLEAEDGRLQIWMHGKLLGVGSNLREAIDVAMSRTEPAE